MRVYPKVSGLTAWSEKCKWYSSLPLSMCSNKRHNYLRKICGRTHKHRQCVTMQNMKRKLEAKGTSRTVAMLLYRISDKNYFIKCCQYKATVDTTLHPSHVITAVVLHIMVT
jgi:hypothetical protein